MMAVPWNSGDSQGGFGEKTGEKPNEVSFQETKRTSHLYEVSYGFLFKHHYLKEHGMQFQN